MKRLAPLLVLLMLLLPLLGRADDRSDGGAVISVQVGDGGETTIDVARGELKVRAAGEETRVVAGERVQGERGKPARHLLRAPGGLEPANGATLPTLTFVARWNTVARASGYRIVVADDAKLTSVVFKDDHVLGTQLSARLPKAGTYWWRVLAFDEKQPAGRQAVGDLQARHRHHSTEAQSRTAAMEVKGTRLAVRLGLLFLAAGLVPLGVTLLVLAPRGQDALRTSAKLLLEAKVDALRARVDGATDDLLADVRLLATPLPAGEATERRALLRFLLEKHQELTCVTLFDGARKLPGGQAYDRSVVGADDIEAHEMKAATLLEAKPSSLRASDFYPSRRGREMLVTFVTPFAAVGPRGYLAAEVSLKRVQDLIADARVGRRGGAFIVDGDGRLVAHRDLQRALSREDLSLVGVVQKLKDNVARQLTTGQPVTVVSDYTDDNIEQVGAYSPLGKLRWGLVVAEPRDDAYGLVRATWAHAAGWVTLALGLSFLVAVLFSRGITRPVARLVEGTQKTASGSFGIVVPVEGLPEIAELARTFNDASRRLARYDTENKELLAAVERGYLETLRALVNAIEAKDPYTAGHSQRTAEVAVAIAQSLRLPDDQLTEIEFGGLLHDIGKIGIAEQILRKPAVLDDAEMKIMRGHPSIGDAIVHDIDLLKKIRPMVRNHHERFDGSGYPDGLKGDEIPLGARIIAVADTYDAITSDRCYQPGRPPKEAVPILKRLSGVTLDRAVVESLFSFLIDSGALTTEDVESATGDAVPRHLPTIIGSGPVDMDTKDDSRSRRPTLEFPAKEFPAKS